MKKFPLIILLTIAFSALSASAHSHAGESLITYTAVQDFPKTDGGAVPYQVPGKEKWRQVLSINAGNPAYRDKFARAERIYDGETGSFDVTIVTLTEFDGECVYRLRIDGEVVGTFTNPRVGKEGDFKPHLHTWKSVALKSGAKLAVESNTASNGLIPEHDSFAWARGRWSELRLSPSETEAATLVFADSILYREAGTVGRKYDGWNSLIKSIPVGLKGVEFSKVSGPSWMRVASSGDLSGVPPEDAIGLNEFEVQLKGANGEVDTAKLRLNVQPADTVYTVGRITVSSDGNHHDPDDWGATTATLGILASQNLQDGLALYIHSDHVWGSSEWGGAEQMHKSAVIGGELFGFDTDRIISGVADPERAYNRLRDEILKSTAADPLVIVAAGPMQVVGEALARAQSKDADVLRYVRCISHSTWNNRHADQPADFESHSGWTWWEIVAEFTDDGVIFDKIHDQNLKFEAHKGLSSGSAGADGKELWDVWFFLRDYDAKDEATNKAIRYIYERMRASKKSDISDAGMVYYLLTGDVAANPQKIETLFDEGFQI